MVGCEPAPGLGPISDCLEIRNWHDLYAIRDNLAGSYLLMNDLDSATPGYMEHASPTANQGKGWQPIGTSDDRFTGSFDGQGYEIMGLFVNRPDESMVGLFGAVDEGGAIRNVGVVNAIVTGEWAVGVLAGGNWGDIRNSYSAGSVSGDDFVGGLVGGNAGGVSNSYSTAAVTGRWDVGGLVGGSDSLGTVSNSYSTGGVTGDWAVGGLVGGNLGGTVSKSYSIASVSGDDYVGGLVGDNQGMVSNSYSTGSVTGDWHVGGLVGENNEGAVSNSFWDVNTSGRVESDGGTGKSTAAIQGIATFTNTATEGLDNPWDIVAVAFGETDAAYTWNIVDGQTYPFLSSHSVS